MKEKIGTCTDAVMVMKAILDEINVQSKIWILRHNVKKDKHTTLTFVAEGKLVYLELTSQSNKPWYGKELLYDDEQNFIECFQNKNYAIAEITDKITVGDTPDSLLRYIDR